MKKFYNFRAKEQHTFDNYEENEFSSLSILSFGVEGKHCLFCCCIIYFVRISYDLTYLFNVVQ